MVKICIDAGHYGKYNRSPAVNGYYESDMAWKLHLLQKKYLEEYGISVILTRDNQVTDKALYDRGAASKGSNLFISNHSNAVGNGVNETIDYVACYYLVDDNRTNIDEVSKEIAAILAPVIADIMGTTQGFRLFTRKSQNDRNGDGQLNDNYYGVLHGARMAGTPGLILEHSFHTNTRMTQWLMDDRNLDRLAKAEADALAAYYGLTQSNLTRITGKAVATVEQMRAYIRRRNVNVAQSVLDMIPLYLSEGEAEGIRGDVAFAQSCLETGNFTFEGSAVTLDQNNFCGMGVLANGMKGNSFENPQLGVRAQIQHLKAYGDTAALVNTCVDPRFKYVVRGTAVYVEWLGQQENPNGKGWAAGAGYGGKILDILNNIIDTPATDAAVENVSGFPAVPFLIKVLTDDLNYHAEPSNDSPVKGKTGKNIFTIVEIKDGWGRLKSGAGWVFLDKPPSYLICS